MFSSFKTKLVLLMLLLSIIPMLLGGAISYTIISQTLTREAKDKLGNIPAPAARRLEALLYFRWNDIQITSHLPLFKESKDYLSKIKYFILQKRLYAPYSWLGATDADGNIIASSDIYDTGKSRDMGSAEWFLRARGISFKDWMTSDQGVVVHDVFISKLSGGIPVVSFTAPIYNFYGEFVGAVHSEIDMSFVAQNIENLHVGETGSAVLVKSDGVIIADKNGVVKAFNRNLGNLKSFNEAQADKSGVLREKVDLGLISGKRKDLNKNPSMPGKMDSFIGYAPLRGYEHFPGLGWAILVVQSADEIYAGARTQALSYGLMFALGVVAVGLGSYFAAKKVTIPIKKLSAAAKMIERGALDLQIKDKTKDEVGELADSFNQMARSLKDSRNELKLERDKLDAIISSMGDALVIIDRDLRIEYMNKTFLELFGSDSLGKLCFCIITGRDEICPNCPLAEPMDLMSSEPIEITAANANTFLVTHTPLRNPDGTFSAVMVLKNVTEMKKLQTQLEEKNRMLEEAYKHLKDIQSQG
jgi:HAMP domain-containing protein